jgi:hypothetical protein
MSTTLSSENAKCQRTGVESTHVILTGVNGFTNNDAIVHHQNKKRATTKQGRIPIF